MGKEQNPSEEDQILVEESSWMIRPCRAYDLEFKECYSIKGRFYQYYADGKLDDCTVWDPMRKNCRKWERNDDTTAGAKMIRFEKQRVAQRLKSRRDNDVWAVRKERPPVNWNVPLPPHIVKKHKDSYLEKHVPDLLQPFSLERTGWCSIS